MKIKAILFDFDGTLADTLPIFIDGVNRLAPKYNYKIIKNIEPFRKLGIKEFLQKWLQLNQIQLIFYIIKLKKISRQKLKKAKLFTGMAKIVKTLGKDHHLGIISWNEKNVIKNVLNNHNINIFEPICGNTLIQKQKKIKKFLKKYNYKKNEVIYIGDGIGDIISAQKANINIISVARGFHHPDKLKSYKPTFSIDRPTQILDIIKPG